MIKGLYEAHLPVSNMDISIAFYEKLGLEMAHRGKRVTFFWIEKGKSWLGLWADDAALVPYHPALRHIAFEVTYEDFKNAQLWLEEKGIEVKEAFGLSPAGPIFLANKPQSHAVIYFDDPDGNALEFICPLEIDTSIHEDDMFFEDWEAQNEALTLRSKAHN